MAEGDDPRKETIVPEVLGLIVANRANLLANIRAEERAVCPQARFWGLADGSRLICVAPVPNAYRARSKSCARKMCPLFEMPMQRVRKLCDQRI